MPKLKPKDIATLNLPDYPTLNKARVVIVRQSNRTADFTVALLEDRRAYKTGDHLTISPSELLPLYPANHPA